MFDGSDVVVGEVEVRRTGGVAGMRRWRSTTTRGSGS